MIEVYCEDANFTTPRRDVATCYYDEFKNGRNFRQATINILNKATKQKEAFEIEVKQYKDFHAILTADINYRISTHYITCEMTYNKNINTMLKKAGEMANFIDYVYDLYISTETSFLQEALEGSTPQENAISKAKSICADIAEFDRIYRLYNELRVKECQSIQEQEINRYTLKALEGNFKHYPFKNIESHKNLHKLAMAVCNTLSNNSDSANEK